MRDTVASDTDDKIMAFEKSFLTLRQNFDTGLNLKTAIVSMHIQADLHEHSPLCNFYFSGDADNLAP
jgi:hypothetical protein